MSRRQKRFAFLGALMGLLHLGREILPLPEFLPCFLMGAAAGLFGLNVVLTDKCMVKLCTWKRQMFARWEDRG